VLEAAAEDVGLDFHELRVDGGMVHDELLMQFQADILGLPVVRPSVVETTALGAAYAAGLATGFWAGLDDLRAHWSESRRWTPAMSDEERARRYAEWNKAVDRTLDWV
jgi:glycerol kinase